MTLIDAAPIFVCFQGLEYENALALVWLPNWLVEVYGFGLMARTKLQKQMKDCHQMYAVVQHGDTLRLLKYLDYLCDRVAPGVAEQEVLRTYVVATTTG